MNLDLMKVLFNDTTLNARYEIIKKYIPENANSELDKLIFMTSMEKLLILMIIKILKILLN